MAVTLADVAAHAGVSPQTVSNVINQPGLVKAETRTRVQRSIHQLGYTVNLRARMLRQQRTGTIGIRVRPFDDDRPGVLFDRLLHELSAQAHRYDKHVMLFTADSEAEEVATIRRMCAQSLAGEFILTDTHPADSRGADLVATGIRFVAFGRPWDAPADEPPHPWVDVDGRAGTSEATRALVSAGHTRIGFLGWPQGSPTGDDRRAGWAAVMLHSGYPEAELERLTVRSEDRLTAAIAAAPRLLDQGVDAVVCASDSLAVGMITAIDRSGASIPVVGFDNTALAASFGFSSVDQQPGSVAGAILAGLERPGDEPRSLLVSPRLVTRSDPRWGIPATPRVGTTPERSTP